MTGHTMISRILIVPAPGTDMWSPRSTERSRNPTTPVASAVSGVPFGGTVIRMCIATRALFARDVRVAEAASSTPGFGAVEPVEAGAGEAGAPRRGGGGARRRPRG